MVTWNVKFNDKEEKVSLIINKLLGLGLVYIEGKLVHKSFSVLRNNKVTFEFNNKKYNLEMKEENLIYSGKLIIDDMQTFESEKKEVNESKTPWYSFIFTLPAIAVPIISIESTVMWFVGILASFFIIKTTKSSKKLISKFIIIILLIAAAWIAYYLYYLRYSPAGFSNPGFIKWKRPMF